MFLTPFKARPMKDGTRKLQEDLVYQTHRNQKIVIPKGFITDGASTLGLILRPFDGKYTRPAVLHDYLYTLLNKGTPHPVSPTRKHADKLFREAMKDEGVGLLIRLSMWGGVRWLGANPLIKKAVIK